VSVQDRYAVCAKRTIGSEIILTHPIGAHIMPNAPLAQKSFSTHSMALLGHEAQLEAHFSPFGDSANLDVR
jgi:hypothetical protein